MLYYVNNPSVLFDAEIIAGIILCDNRQREGCTSFYRSERIENQSYF
ncbi:MAG: hypothetical protein JWP81_1338 [Ferruginibacter sp.]|nr:hypothetical protein [Ferruginibacter sp.]